MKAIVYHSGYGCDTGCCGHVVALEDDLGNEIKHEFNFDHPYHVWANRSYGKEEIDQKIKTFVQDMVTSAFGAEHVADIDFDECVVSFD